MNKQEPKFKVLSDEALEDDIRKDYKDFRVDVEGDRIGEILLWTREAQLRDTLRQVVEWGNSDCPHVSHSRGKHW